MRLPSKPDIMAMSRRAYVDKARGVTKVIFGDDEWQIVLKCLDGSDAKSRIGVGTFDMELIEPAVIDENVLAIREELRRLGAKITEIYGRAERRDAFRMYDRGVTQKTDAIAYDITGILRSGITKSAD